MPATSSTIDCEIRLRRSGGTRWRMEIPSEVPSTTIAIPATKAWRCNGGKPRSGILTMLSRANTLCWVRM